MGTLRIPEWVASNHFYRKMSGIIIQAILTVNTAIFFFLLILAIRLFFLVRDIKRTLKRFDLVGEDSPEFNPDSNESYFARARTVFAENPEVAIYAFGHTHDALLLKERGRLIISTGTWLKILYWVTVRIKMCWLISSPAANRS